MIVAGRLPFMGQWGRGDMNVRFRTYARAFAIGALIAGLVAGLARRRDDAWLSRTRHAGSLAGQALTGELHPGSYGARGAYGCSR